jgi:CelD/BcsL family acetyltransferase involved in cellulose biosynthesis
VADPSTIPADEWDALADAAGAGPFVRPGWLDAFTRAFGDGAPPELVPVRRDGRLVAVLPLVPARGGGLRSPTNWHTPAYGPVALDDDAARAVAQAALARSRAWLDCSFLDPGAAFTRALEEAGGPRLISRPVLRSPYVRLEGDFEAYCSSLPSKFFREIRRRRRRLEADHGAVEVAFTDGREALERQLDEGFTIEGSGWKTEQGTAIAQDPATERFYREVAAWAAGRGWLQLGFVRVAGRAVAFSYSIVLHGTVHVVKVGFDPAFARYAVGTLLTNHAIERAFSQGMTTYDFLGAEDRYKLDWTSEVRERVRVQAFSRSPAGTAAYVAWRHGRPAARRALAWRRGR